MFIHKLWRYFWLPIIILVVSIFITEMPYKIQVLETEWIGPNYRSGDIFLVKKEINNIEIINKDDLILVYSDAENAPRLRRVLLGPGDKLCYEEGNMNVAVPIYHPDQICEMQQLVVPDNAYIVIGGQLGNKISDISVYHSLVMRKDIIGIIVKKIYP